LVDTFLRITKEAADLAGNLLVAVDQKIGGIYGWPFNF
jgi:hypothetical protein